MKKHFVEFLSPGTIVAESTVREIDSWDVAKAVKMSREIKERHGATPYGFRFLTRERGEGDFDSREVARSPFYYLHCQVLTIEEIREGGDPKDKILLHNMEANGWNEVVRTTRGWLWSQPLNPGDVVLNMGQFPEEEGKCPK